MGFGKFLQFVFSNLEQYFFTLNKVFIVCGRIQKRWHFDRYWNHSLLPPENWFYGWNFGKKDINTYRKGYQHTRRKRVSTHKNQENKNKTVVYLDDWTHKTWLILTQHRGSRQRIKNFVYFFPRFGSTLIQPKQINPSFC